MSPNRIPSPRLSFALTLGTMLALSACSTTKTVTVPDTEALAAEQRKAAAAEEALQELRDTLAGAQAALLGPGTSGADPAAQRRALAQELQNNRNTVQEAQRALAPQPDSEAKTATLEALRAVDTALARTAEALAASDTALVSGAGLLVFANMHTTLDRALDRALAAIDDAQAKLRTALGANPSETLRATLSQAQTLLTTAQLSLMPQLRQELAQAAAAEEALEELRDTLAGAQAALGPGTPGADPAAQRRAQAQALQNAQNTVQEAQEELATQPDSAAKTATLEALGAVDTALARTREALAADMANMRTTLNRALVALDDAQAKLATALGADPSETLRATLSQARTLLTTAQVSLVPQLRRELETAAAAEEALEELRASLEEAQAALGPGTPGADPAAQRRAQAQALQNAQNTVQEAREELGAQPDSEAKTATLEALGAVDTALARTREAVEAEDMANMRTTLDRALAALDDAQAKLATALGANPSETLRATLSQARTLLTTAQVSLVPQLREERDALRDEHVSPPLFRSTAGPRGDLGATITITRTARTVPNTAGDEWVANPDKLDIATDAVPWAAGRTLTSRAGNEEFPMRAITFRGDIRQGSQRGKTGADANNDGRYPIIQGPGNTLGNANDHTKNAVISSIQLSEDGGLILKAGGSGIVFNEFQYDIRGTEADGPDGIPGDGGATTSTTATAYHVAMFRRAGETAPTVGATLTQAQADKLTGWAADNCSGVTFPCWDGNMRDLTIDFGKPSPDPDGESGYHWASKIPSSTDQPKPAAADAMHRWAKPKVDNFVDPERGNGEHRGEYRVWLSNYAGLDTGATDAATDDSHRYLQYAAYGLFTFTDYLTSNVRPARMQGFHFGYEAFADTAGMRTTDLDTPITATFAGRASGMVMEPHSDRSQVERLIRVRGDVTLNATIGGANTITGAISNFETPAGGGWGPYAPLRDEVRLTNGTIATGGSYEGDADVEGGSGHLWDPGKFGGNFYGNRGGSDLETAGWWYLTARGYTPDARALTGAAARDDPGRPDFRYSGAFGSFGAKCTTGCSN